MTSLSTQVVKAPASGAGHPAVPGVTQEHQQFLTFHLGEEMFAIGILSIREIIEYGQLTEVPLVPSFIRGVINLRGSVVPVIDLAARFGGKTTQVARRTCIVIIEVVDQDFRSDIGILVDAVSEVLEIPASEIEPPPSFGAKIRADFIFGMGKVSGKFVIILNINNVLSVEEIGTIAEIGGSANASASIANNSP